jgi:hypothetical protein
MVAYHLAGFPLLFPHKYKIFSIVYMYTLFFNKMWNIHIIDISKRVATVQKVLGNFFELLLLFLNECKCIVLY